MRKRNKELARAGGSIDVKSILSCLPHNIRTAEAYEAYGEKLEEWGDSQAQIGIDWDAEIEEVRAKHSNNCDVKARSPVESLGSSSSVKNLKRKRKTSPSSDASYASKSTVASSSTRRCLKREMSALSIVRSSSYFENDAILSVLPGRNYHY